MPERVQTILVTGGAGFIGTHLCRSLVQKGHRVRVLDLKDPESRIRGVEYLRGDISNSELLERSLVGVSAVYHFAALVSVPVCEKKPFESYEKNLISTARVLEAIKNRPIRFLFAGSAAVYSTLGEFFVPLREDQHLPQPVSIYAVQKLGSEHLIDLYRRRSKIPSVVFRFFNVFGPGQDPNSPYPHRNISHHLPGERLLQ